MIRCRVCFGSHKLTAENFPIKLQDNIEIFQGSGKKRKSLGTHLVVIGYMCKKCVNKGEREKFIKQHNLKAAPGQRMLDIIRNKLDELKKAGG